MQTLYKGIMDSRPSQGITLVDALLYNSGLYDSTKKKLESLGYNLSALDIKGVACLFFALNDILVVREKNGFYLCTLSTQKLGELINLNRLVPRSDEDANFLQTNKIIFGNTLAVINNYLSQGKFHVIKLNMLESCRTYCFMTSVGTMNPYPTFKDKEVYALGDIAMWHNSLYNQLVTGVHRLKLTDNRSVICQSYLSETKSIASGCTLITMNTDNTMVEYPIWEIKGIEQYSDNDFVQKLLTGVVKYDGKNITLNRKILEKYYGKKLYTTLESKGVRQRYALEELLAIGDKYSVSYYVNKYNLEIFDCQDIIMLEAKLRGIIKPERRSDKSVNARILYSADALSEGYKSFYQTVNLSSLDGHSIEYIENTEDLMPRDFEYYAISKESGYTSVSVRATSLGLAKKYGELEFKRKFGSHEYFTGVVSSDGVVLEGLPVFNLTISQQYNLCQSIMYGYKSNYDGIYKSIQGICSANGFAIKDDYVKFLFVNRLARIYKQGADVKLWDVSKVLLDFLNLLKCNKCDSLLISEFQKIAISKARREFNELSKLGSYDLYDIEDTKDGKFIQTDYGRFKITDKGISSSVDIYYRGQKICHKSFKEES